MTERVDVEALAMTAERDGRAWLGEKIRALGRERDETEAALDALWRAYPDALGRLGAADMVMPVLRRAGLLRASGEGEGR